MKEIQAFLYDTMRGAGEIIVNNYGKVKSRRAKDDRGDIVTK